MKKVSFARRYIQEVIFGFEDSFVSTVGAVTGMAAGVSHRGVVILAGVVIIVVEATSMAAGSYISDKAKRDAAKADGHECRLEGRSSVMAGVVMGISYLVAGIFPVLPYIFLPVAKAIAPSIILTLVMLFLVGVWQTRFTKRSWIKSGSEILLVGGAAIVIGFAVGRVASHFLGIDIF